MSTMFQPRMPPDGDRMGDGMVSSAQLSHSMDQKDPACPSNWPLHRKVYVSFATWCCAAAVVFGLTAYTTDINAIVADFGLNPSDNPNFIPVNAISGYSLYLFGIFFAPIWAPHVTERIGRSIFYLTALPLCGLFLLGAGFSKSFAGVAILRFLAGFAGGPCIVLLEGTFAEIWSAEYTNTYYAVQATAQFIGAGLGPLIGGYLVQASGNWRWTQWFSAALCGLAFVLALGISESYQREIPRRQAKREGRQLQQDPPLSGSTFGEIIRITGFDPIRQLFTEPVVMLSTIFLVFNFAVMLQFFITVPVALGSPPPMGRGFSLGSVGLAFTTAIVGGTLGALSVILIEQVVVASFSSRNVPDFAKVEYRLVPAMIGPILVTAALFWIGGTVADPTIRPVVPIIGTAVYVWGAAMVIMSVVPYLFDVYAPAGTLSAITAAATGRLLVAGVLPLVILQFFTKATPKWALFTFGFISIPLWAVPFILFRFGPILREKSKFSSPPESDPMEAGMQRKQERDQANGNTNGNGEYNNGLFQQNGSA